MYLLKIIFKTLFIDFNKTRYRYINAVSIDCHDLFYTTCDFGLDLTIKLSIQFHKYYFPLCGSILIC